MRNIRPIANVRAEQADGTTPLIRRRGVCIDSDKQFVVQILIRPIHASDFINNAIGAIFHDKMNPEFSLLAESRGNTVPRPDILDEDGNFESSARGSRPSTRWPGGWDVSGGSEGQRT